MIPEQEVQRGGFRCKVIKWLVAPVFIAHQHITDFAKFKHQPLSRVIDDELHRLTEPETAELVGGSFMEVDAVRQVNQLIVIEAIFVECIRQVHGVAARVDIVTHRQGYTDIGREGDPFPGCIEGSQPERYQDNQQADCDQKELFESENATFSPSPKNPDDDYGKKQKCCWPGNHRKPQRQSCQQGQPEVAILIVIQQQVDYQEVQEDYQRHRQHLTGVVNERSIDGSNEARGYRYFEAIESQ